MWYIFVLFWWWPLYINTTVHQNSAMFNSGAPAAEGRHAEPHTYRTFALIFVWSSLSAVNGSRARTYVRTTTTTSHNKAPILVNLCILYIYAIWYWRSILWSIDSWQIKESADQCHMTISRNQVGAHGGKVFFESDRWRGYGISLDRGLKNFPIL